MGVRSLVSLPTGLCLMTCTHSCTCPSHPEPFATVRTPLESNGPTPGPALLFYPTAVLPRLLCPADDYQPAAALSSSDSSGAMPLASPSCCCLSLSVHSGAPRTWLLHVAWKGMQQIWGFVRKRESKNR